MWPVPWARIIGHGVPKSMKADCEPETNPNLCPIYTSFTLENKATGAQDLQTYSSLKI